MITKRDGKRGTTWRVLVQGSPMPNGERPSLSGTFTSQREAKEAEARFKVMLHKGAAKTSQTIGLYLEAWNEKRKRTVAATTCNRQADFITTITPRIGHIKMKSLTTADLEDLYDWLLDYGRKDGKGGLSPQTVLHIHRMIHKAYEDAIRRGLTHENPASRAVPPKVPKRDLDIPELPVVSEQMVKIKKCRCYPAAAVMLATGARCGEVAGLQWDDLDVDTGELKIRRAIVRVKQVNHIKEPKSESGIRTVTVSQQVIDILLEWKKKQDVELAMLRKPHSRIWMFTNEKGEVVVPNTLSTSVRSRTNASIHAHKFRHLHATQLLANDVPVKQVSERLGHSTPVVTMTVYAHTTNQTRERARASADALVGSVLTG